MRALVSSLITALQSFTVREIAEVAFALGKASTLASTKTLIQRDLNTRVATGELERLGPVYRIKNSQSEHKTHSQLINKHILPFYKLPFEVIIKKECVIQEKNIRADFIVFLKNSQKACCAVVECMDNESEASIVSKSHIWAGWSEATDYLSRLFRTRIRKFSFVVSGDFCPQYAITYEQFMSEVRKEVEK